MAAVFEEASLILADRRSRLERNEHSNSYRITSFLPDGGFIQEDVDFGYLVHLVSRQRKKMMNNQRYVPLYAEPMCSNPSYHTVIESPDPFGIQSVYVPRGDPKMSKLAGGLSIIEYTGKTPPEPMKLLDGTCSYCLSSSWKDNKCISCGANR